jgi:hypothetical protein
MNKEDDMDEYTRAIAHWIARRKAVVEFLG